MDSFDFVIIGGGSAGIAAAIKADQLGASVALIEKGPLGGTCVNIGCVPTKNLLRAAEVVHLARQKNIRSIQGRQYVNLNFKTAMAEAREVVEELRRRKYEEPLRKLRDFYHFKGNAVSQ